MDLSTPDIDGRGTGGLSFTAEQLHIATFWGCGELLPSAANPLMIPLDSSRQSGSNDHINDPHCVTQRGHTTKPKIMHLGKGQVERREEVMEVGREGEGGLRKV